MICSRLAAAACLLYSLIHENLEGCHAYMPNLRGDATAPLHKLDIVQVILHASKVTKAKADKSGMSGPVHLLFPFHNLYR